MELDKNKVIVIKGVTKDGRRFRPSDWAQRLSTAAAAMVPTPPQAARKARRPFHPKVNTAIIDGINSVVVEKSLAEEDPRLYKFLINFAKENDLVIENLD